MAPKRKRQRRKKRTTEISSDSDSSSSSEEEQVVIANQDGKLSSNAVQETSSESDSDSSDTFSQSSSDHQDPPASLITTSTTQKHVTAPTQKPQKSIQNRPRSPSPPYFTFNPATNPLLSTDPSTAKQPLSKEDEDLRDHYLEKMFENFGSEIDAFKQEPGIASRLDTLVDSLKSGASLMATAKLATSLFSPSLSEQSIQKIESTSKVANGFAEDVEMTS